jgi:hypothetical protein
MRQIILSTALLLLISTLCFGQSGIYFDIEPNFLMARKYYSTNGSAPSYLKSKNNIGIGGQFGYQKSISKNFYLDGNVHLLMLNNSVGIDFATSGFDQLNHTNLGSQSYSTDYYTSLGIGLMAGYKILISKKIYCGIALGGHLDISSLGGGIGIGAPTNEMVYNERIISKSPQINPGIDGDIDFNIITKKPILFVGIHCSLGLGNKLSGTYDVFSNYRFGQSGTFQLNRNYFGLALGLRFLTF